MTTICLCWNYKNWIKLDQLHSFSLSFFPSHNILLLRFLCHQHHHPTYNFIKLILLEAVRKNPQLFYFYSNAKDHAQQLSRFNIATKMNSKKEKNIKKSFFLSLSLACFACSLHSLTPQHSSIYKNECCWWEGIVQSGIVKNTRYGSVLFFVLF